MSLGTIRLERENPATYGATVGWVKSGQPIRLEHALCIVGAWKRVESAVVLDALARGQVVEVVDALAEVNRLAHLAQARVDTLALRALADYILDHREVTR